MAFIPTCRWLVVHSSLMFVVSLAGIFNVVGVCRWSFISRPSMLRAIFTMLSYDPSWSLKSDRDRSVPDDAMRLAVAPIKFLARPLLNEEKKHLPLVKSTVQLLLLMSVKPLSIFYFAQDTATPSLSSLQLPLPRAPLPPLPPHPPHRRAHRQPVDPTHLHLVYALDASGDGYSVRK
ncbi:hypothetical protein B296_00036504 [Ensete ventricosum]|uniref:Uncharacterized protein n=1 Tax=Ensete ventricosum TaxID=4639 RepID=A0A426YR27_ENSVE|nr:hypothetical protein B296_00036504 [Ensete ventricosum]